jgi:hypothetical protein
MKRHCFRTLLLALSCLVGGCTSGHLIDIDVANGGELAPSRQLASTDAVILFQRVARQYGLVVTGPIGSQSKYPHYIAMPPKHSAGPLGNCSLSMYVVKSGVIIYCESSLGGKPLALIEGIASSFTTILNEQSAHYRITQRTGSPLNY